MIAKLTAALLAGGSFVAAELPNPNVGECVIADVVVTRTNPTMIDTDGEVTGLRAWAVCGYQVPTGDGANMRAVDDEFVLDIDIDQATDIVSAAGELVEGDG